VVCYMDSRTLEGCEPRRRIFLGGMEVQKGWEKLTSWWGFQPNVGAGIPKTLVWRPKGFTPRRRT